MPLDRRTFLAAGAASVATVAASATTTTTATASGAADARVGQTRGPTRVWEVGEAGGFDTLRMVTRETPVPRADQVLVEVHMSGVAARDQGVVRGWFLEDKPPTLIPLSEGVGTVLQVGEAVGHIAVGDRVTCVHFARWINGPWSPANYQVDVGNTVDGWLGQRIVLPASGVTRVPAGISDATAATLSGSAITAWHALHHVARVKAGDTVLTLGTGGVSSWGLLLARAAGARVVVTSSSDEKLAQMRALGAEVTVNYRRESNWGEKIAAQTGGVDIVLENVGRQTLEQSMLACASNAMIVMIGTGRLPERLPEMPGFYLKNLGMRAISNGSRQMMEELLRAIDANGIEAQIGRVFAFEQVVEAFEFAAASGHVGKVLIDHRS